MCVMQAPSLKPKPHICTHTFTARIIGIRCYKGILSNMQDSIELLQFKKLEPLHEPSTCSL